MGKHIRRGKPAKHADACRSASAREFAVNDQYDPPNRRGRTAARAKARKKAEELAAAEGES